MRPKSTSGRALAQLLPLDLIFLVLIPVLFAQTLEIPEPWTAAATCALLLLVRAVVWAVSLRTSLAPVDAWDRASPRERTDALFERALESTRATPTRFLWTYGTGWAVAIGLSLALTVARHAGPDGLSPRFWVAGLLALLTIVMGSSVLAYTLSGSILLSLATPIQLEAQRRGHGALHVGTPIGTRITTLSICFAITGLGWLGAIGHRVADAGAAREAALVARLAAEDALDGTEAELRRERADGAQTRLLGADDGDVPAALAAWARDAARDRPAGWRIQAGADRAAAYAVRTDGRVVVAIAPISSQPANLLLLAVAAFIAVVSVWAPISAFAFGRDVASGIDRLTRAAGRVVEIGDLRAMEPLPIMSTDELGEATRHQNELVETLRVLARTTERVAAGELGLDLPGQGELQDSFRGMLQALREIVGQVRDTTVQLASTAAEIYSASQEQEAAASQQSAGIAEVSQTMESLAGAAGHIADSSGNVLGDAERTRATTDQMAARIAELNAHAGRIAELLETIRDVADRSDLLALNGSLEATRAGEAGRGFALVASEMRRLAERVTATVESVRGLVGDIRASGSSTVMATEQSRKVAESTSEAARKISLVTQQQRTATEQVTAAVREIADVIAQAATATTQTRVSAEELKAQADRLDVLLRRFDLGRFEAPPPEKEGRRAA